MVPSSRSANESVQSSTWLMSPAQPSTDRRAGRAAPRNIAPTLYPEGPVDQEMESSALGACWPTAALVAERIGSAEGLRGRVVDGELGEAGQRPRTSAGATTRLDPLRGVRPSASCRVAPERTAGVGHPPSFGRANRLLRQGPPSEHQSQRPRTRCPSGGRRAAWPRKGHAHRGTNPWFPWPDRPDAPAARVTMSIKSARRPSPSPSVPMSASIDIVSSPGSTFSL